MRHAEFPPKKLQKLQNLTCLNKQNTDSNKSYSIHMLILALILQTWNVFPSVSSYHVKACEIEKENWNRSWDAQASNNHFVVDTNTSKVMDNLLV